MASRFVATLLAVLLCISCIPTQCMEPLMQVLGTVQWLDGRALVITTNKAFPNVPCMGLGDQFQYIVPYAHYLTNRGADVAIEVSKPLKTIFSKTSPFKEPETQKTYESVELADLYTIFKHLVPTFACTSPALQCPEDRMLVWRERILSICHGKRPVVIFTSGNTIHNTNRFPTTADWNNLTKELPMIQFFNGQYKGDDISNTIRPSDLDQQFDNEPFMDTMAVVVATVRTLCGIVISPDTGTLHLCASSLEGYTQAQKKVWCPLTYNADQRWKAPYTKTTSESETVSLKSCVWYPTAVQLYQQKKDGDWHSVIQQMKSDLKQYALHGPRPFLNI